jgi:hypothetical protein
VARQIVLGRAAEPRCDQQGIGKDIQHDLTPFRLVMLSFAMKRAVIRFNKVSEM